MKIFIAQILCIIVNHANGYIEEKGLNRYLIFDSTDENKELLKIKMMFGMKLGTKLRN